jgi:hypothetical protein
MTVIKKTSTELLFCFRSFACRYIKRVKEKEVLTYYKIVTTQSLVSYADAPRKNREERDTFKLAKISTNDDLLGFIPIA